jgi:hypothetical protein
MILIIVFHKMVKIPLLCLVSFIQFGFTFYEFIIRLNICWTEYTKKYKENLEALF